MPIQAGIRPAFFTYLQEMLHGALSVHGLSSSAYRLLVSKPGIRSKPREAGGVTGAGAHGLFCRSQEEEEN